MRFTQTAELSYRTLLLIILVGLFIVPTVVVGLVWYGNSTAIIEKNSIEYTETVVGQLSSRFEDYFGELERSTYLLTTQPVVGDFLTATDNDAYSLFRLRQALEDDVLTGLTYSRGDVLNLALISVNGAVLSTYRDASAREGYEWYLERSHGFESYASSFRIAGVRTVNSVPVLTVVRLIREQPYLEIDGVLLIDLNYRRISEILDSALAGIAGTLMLVNADGSVLYHTDRARIGESIDVSDWGGRSILASKEALIVRIGSPRTGLHVVSRIPREQLFAELGDLLIFTAILGIVVIALALVAVGTTTVSLANGLRDLQRYMEEVEGGNLDVQAPEPRTREMRSLYNSFNTMITEVSRLIERVRTAEARENELKIAQLETEILAIQSQINPHFLYNTLEIVNSYAIERGVEPIVAMVSNLARMFRYNVDSGSRTVPLRAELNHIRSYLDIQRENYTDLNVVIDTADFLLDSICTVRLTLQPIVENAFLHGYQENTSRQVSIEITARADDSGCVLAVRDRGAGMEQAQRDRYNSLFGAAQTEEIIATYRDVGRASIGLLNVHTRLRLAFGSAYGLRIATSVPTGTTVEIRLPRREGACST